MKKKMITSIVMLFVGIIAIWGTVNLTPLTHAHAAGVEQTTTSSQAHSTSQQAACNVEVINPDGSNCLWVPGDTYSIASVSTVTNHFFGTVTIDYKTSVNGPINSFELASGDTAQLNGNIFVGFAY